LTQEYLISSGQCSLCL